MSLQILVLIQMHAISSNHHKSLHTTNRKMIAKLHRHENIEVCEEADDLTVEVGLIVVEIDVKIVEVGLVVVALIVVIGVLVLVVRIVVVVGLVDVDVIVLSAICRIALNPRRV